MRPGTIAGILACGFAVGASAATPSPPAGLATGPSALSAVDPASEQTVRLDPAEGPMHLVFLATWCRPCVAEMPRLFDLEDRWKAEGYRLFLIAMPTRQSPERLKAFLEEGPVPGRLLFDRSGSVASALGVTTIPSHVLVDRAGRIVARSVAVDTELLDAVERLVRQEGRPQP